MTTDYRTSHTALTVAVLRAAHQLLDGAPKVLEDRVVLDLLPADALEPLRTRPETFQTPLARWLRSHVVVRSRYTEDHLAAAVGRGLRQYVVLGAGFDTFAFRQPAWARELQIVEIDQPATQSAKRQRLAEAGIAEPANLRFVPVDFEKVSLRDALRAAGVAFDEPVFFSWLGVMMYLTTDAVDAAFRVVAEAPPSSEIVFTFARPFQEGDELAPSLARWAAAVGEPWVTFFEPEDLAARLRDLGFTHVEFLSTEETASRYLADRVDGLPVPKRTSIGAARR